ncbi:MAG: peptidoglycan DD-metalloendopeptidase family protein [Candidatus Eisenbacteria bacterium]|nr:peptidoglycan DD-metalloendopeptidase family protein [Candidatus Eisenbacteria bacterium]
MRRKIRSIIFLVLSLALAVSSPSLGQQAAQPGSRPASQSAAQPSARPAGLPAAQPGTQPTELEKQIRGQEKELEQTKKELEQKRKKARLLMGKEKTAFQALKRTEEELRLTEKYVQKLTKREETFERELTATRDEVTGAREALRLQTELLAWRLREIYKYGRTNSLEFLLSSESFAQLLSRFRYLALVAESDRNLMQGFDHERLQFEASEAKLSHQLAGVSSLRNEKEKEKGNLLTLKTRKRQTASQIQNERRSYEEAAKELEGAAARIQAVLEQLERRRREELAKKIPAPEWMAQAEFEKNRGTLNWPVSGSITGKFGNNTHPRFGTTTFNPGVDISAPLGTEIRAVAKARVDYSSWLAGLGNCIILDHGGGYYTIYAHASEVFVRVGQEVAIGQAIGKVGDSGSLKGSCLHFEIRKGKQALDPTAWLR